jgi:hypothetical protein
MRDERSRGNFFEDMQLDAYQFGPFIEDVTLFKQFVAPFNAS